MAEHLLTSSGCGLRPFEITLPQVSPSKWTILTMFPLPNAEA